MTIVQATGGALEGVQRAGHLAFYNIPFATAERFRAPVPARPWEGVRPAAEVGFAAPQTAHPIPGFAASGPQDEDCLNLNVFTPAADGGRRPVLFWIHGGGFTHGTGSDPLYNGGPLATRGDVVVVTINYRLGALGYLSLADHLPDAGLTANNGQLDQVAALEWVRDNIAAFGGDPDNVTIFGESAGAAAVGCLLAMPLAAGLFHRAILQSGAGRASTRETARQVVDSLLGELGLTPDRALELLMLPVDAILEAQSQVAAKNRGMLAFGPVLDDATLPAAPLDAIRAGASSNIPVLIGTNRDEVKLFAAAQRRDPLEGEALVAAVARSLPKEHAAEAASLIETYRASRMATGLPVDGLDLLDAIDTDLRFRIGALRLALARQDQRPGTFVYLFTYASPARRGALGSCHALEMPFVFGTLDAPTQDRFAGTGPAVEGLSANMMEAWLAFARTGDPSHEGIGSWPAYEAESRPTMIFDAESRLEMDPFGEERQAIEALVP